MTPYEWIGYCVAWAVAIGCTALPFIFLAWALEKAISNCGLFMLWVDFLLHERDEDFRGQIVLHGWRWWRWKKYKDKGDAITVVESWDDDRGGPL